MGCTLILYSLTIGVLAVDPRLPLPNEAGFGFKAGTFVGMLIFMIETVPEPFSTLVLLIPAKMRGFSNCMALLPLGVAVFFSSAEPEGTLAFF